MHQMKTMFRRLLASALPALALVSAAHAVEPVKVGLAIARTGDYAPAAQGQLNAYQMWADQVNAGGGLDVAGVHRPVQLVVYDDQSDFGKDASIYEKLITNDKVDLLLSPWGTPAHFAVVGVLERYGFPMVGSSAASLQIRAIKARNIWFPTSAVPDKMATALVDLMREQHVKTIAIQSIQLPFPQEVRTQLLTALASSGIKVAVDRQYSPGIQDMTAMVGAIKSAAPDAVISLSYPSDSILYMRTAREQGIKAPFQFVLVGPTAPFFHKMFGKSLDDIVTIGHWSPHQAAWPKAKPFFDAYVKRYGEPPDYLDVALAWMSTEILQQAVTTAGLSHDKLRQAISSTTFDTIDGPVRFDGVQNVSTPTMFLQFQKGEAQIVYPASTATAKFVPKTSWDN